ncbi:MAG TPA: DUF502 domain-containing protein [Burkholderiaceae bacterium]|jgi:uncharacterized membrane protein|nr:DUF502 domain-containing protein [Burkholderiaceae bacterium]
MLKKYLITGLLIWVPLAFTIWVLDLIVSSMDRTLLLLPPPWRPESWLGFQLPGAGLLLSALVLLLTGMAAANIMGQRLVRWWEGLLSRIPIVRSIYSSVKQVSDTLLSPDGNSFRRAVLVEFPQRGQWSVAFVVGAPNDRVTGGLDGDFVVVYVPTAPNPTSGYTLIVPQTEVRDLDMTVDDALKFVISLGVVGAQQNSKGQP